MKKDLVQLQLDFTNLRLGTFIHFNSATFQFAEGEVVDWESYCGSGEEPLRHPFDPGDWNPAELDCEQWAAAAKSSGAEFACLTAKHHEGFALWPSAFTGHSVKNGAVKTDVVARYLKAFREAGLKAGLYFSMLDLHHGIHRGKCTPEDKKFIRNQLTELLTGYGEIPFLIVDGWNAPWGGPDYGELPFEEIDGLVKGLQPDCLLMNIGEQGGVERTDVAFCENAAGQRVDDDFEGPGACCNIFTDQWFWRASDPGAELKPADWALDLIREMNRKNVAFLMNLSPNRTGRLDGNLVRRFAEVGEKYRKPADLGTVPSRWLRRKT